MRTLHQIIMGLEARHAAIGKLYIERRWPALVEFYKLSRQLRERALVTGDYQTIAWVNSEHTKLERAYELISDELAQAENEEMSTRHPNLTEEQIIAHWKHIDELSELAEQKLEKHIKYIQEMNARLRAKLAERDTELG